jgi:anti-sigma regulatory factor (Ser/Thr protein kinase)
MIYANECVNRKPWDLPFLAESTELAGLRRVLRLHLTLWGLPELIEDAQACVTELAANVIAHVGPGTPATLAVAMKDTSLRIEMHDPDSRVLPTLLDASGEAESGRGMLLVDALAERWGVDLRADLKVVWCELATKLNTPQGHVERAEVARAEGQIGLYGALHDLSYQGRLRRTGGADEEQVAIALVTDLLHWLRAHGCDPDQALDEAQAYFEAEVG